MNSAPQGVGVLRLALDLLRSDEKSAADREAKLAVLRFLAALEGRGDDYLKGFREGFAEGFREGFVAAWRKSEAISHPAEFREWINQKYGGV